MNLPGSEFDPHQHVQGLQPDGLHGEEVAGQYAGPLVAENTRRTRRSRRLRRERITAGHCRRSDRRSRSRATIAFLDPTGPFSRSSDHHPPAGSSRQNGRYPFAEIPTATAYLEQGHARGKVVAEVSRGIPVVCPLPAAASRAQPPGRRRYCPSTSRWRSAVPMRSWPAETAEREGGPESDDTPNLADSRCRGPSEG
jgi:hypothetical protein